MVAEPKSWFSTAAEYLANERRAETKSEFLNGEIIAMVGASPTHVRLNSNVQGRLFMQLDGKPCEVFAQDLRVAINEAGDYVYPDVVVGCAAEFDGDNLLNPRVIIEVLSPSTRLKGRTTKFEIYLRVPSLSDLIFIAQNRIRVDQYHREQNAAWTLKILEDRQDELALEAIGCHLKVADIYARVDLTGLSDELQMQQTDAKEAISPL